MLGTRPTAVGTIRRTRVCLLSGVSDSSANRTLSSGVSGRSLMNEEIDTSAEEKMRIKTKLLKGEFLFSGESANTSSRFVMPSNASLNNNALLSSF